jgi:hypothetical protein
MVENGDTKAKPRVVSNDQQYKSLYHRVYILGLPLLGAAVTSALAWKESHLLALLILASFAVLVSIYELRVRGWDAGPIAAFSVCWYVLAWIVFLLVGPNLPVETDSEVYLVPGNKPAPPAPCDRFATKQPNGSIAFLIGSNEFWSSRDGGSNIITLDSKPIVSMKKSDRGLLFDIEMFDLNKKLVAKKKKQQINSDIKELQP